MKALRTPPHEDRLSRIVDGAVFVGCEAFNCDLRLDVDLLALEREAHATMKCLDGRSRAGRDDAEMIDPLDQSGSAPFAGRYEWLGEGQRHPFRGGRWQPDLGTAYTSYPGKRRATQRRCDLDCGSGGISASHGNMRYARALAVACRRNDDRGGPGHEGAHGMGFLPARQH